MIGDFEEGEARRFLEWELNKLGFGVKMDDATWVKVYLVRRGSIWRFLQLRVLVGLLLTSSLSLLLQVCGGNAGALRRLARNFSRSSDWDTGARPR